MNKVATFDFDNSIIDTATILPKAYYLLTGDKSLKETTTSWNLDDCYPPKADREIIHKIFDIPLFFELAKQYIIPGSQHIMFEASKLYDIEIVSCGTESNLKLKEKFCKEYFPFAKFIGINNATKSFDKSEYLQNSAFIFDDRLDCLASAPDSCKRILVRYRDLDYEWQNGYKELLEQGKIDAVITEYNSNIIDMMNSYHNYLTIENSLTV